MQFKMAGSRVQVLAYRGYDKEKRRAIVKMMGSLDKIRLEPTDRLLDNLTPDEQKELQSYIEGRRQELAAVDLRYCTATLADHLAEAADALGKADLLTQEEAEKVWEGLARLQKSLRRAGFPKPKPEAKAKSEPKVGDNLPGLE